MKNFYIAIEIAATIEGSNGKIGYCAYVLSVSSSDNLVSKLAGIGGLHSANIAPTKKEAENWAAFWNIQHREIGDYLYQNGPSF